MGEGEMGPADGLTDGDRLGVGVGTVGDGLTGLGDDGDGDGDWDWDGVWLGCVLCR